MKFFSLLISSFAIIQMAMAGDPDILTDFIVLPNVTNVDGNFFTFTGLRDLFKGGPSTTLKVSKVILAEFSTLNGQSVSYAVLGYPAGTTSPPHVHPRASELLFVVEVNTTYNTHTPLPRPPTGTFLIITSTIFSSKITRKSSRTSHLHIS
uniref:Cupin type-1 domain-containing protein n=1 Tax=Quercus lobata TaxID=97700 RepID=A0A7N2KLJ4_QUELO